MISTKQITVISGIRRSGKSTLLTQFASRYKNYYYINFDDERLINFTVDDFHNLMLVFHKLYQADVIFLDEVQNIEGWERFIRRIHDEEYKIFLTGSNARLLSSELATHLTGRYVKIELYPFSFREYLSFHRIDYDVKTSKKKAIVLRYFDKYLRGGGFPEFVKS
ncbi:MAG: AAA family ATPase [Nitrospirae bacterium]|nr:AAA family ATPase [Nitrospirota bacterium]